MSAKRVIAVILVSAALLIPGCSAQEPPPLIHIYTYFAAPTRTYAHRYHATSPRTYAHRNHVTSPQTDAQRNG